MQGVQVSITGVLIAVSITMSILTSTGILSQFSITLDWYGISRGELWRLLTGMLYFGPVSFNWILFLASNVRYLSALEKESYAVKKREFVLLLVYSQLATLLLSKFVKINYAAMPFFSVLSYVWARKHPDQIFVALGFLHFPAAYLSIFNILMAVLQR